ncbi:hypothetical protein WJX81_005482 [Elliptochloris bilobata]|uniref:Uncharacterized protein n=1 Tax=Elliptochloris bilobata TaxID=381761 RepID=A0AAW1RGC4_9CHLO
MFLAGGTAGAVARTVTAPADRLKLLFQVQAMASSGVSAKAYTSLRQAALKVFREEGMLAFWKGNSANVVRIFPYSAAQLMSNDYYKRLLASQDGGLTVLQRLAAGAGAGMTATALTHPIDTLRLRLALPGSAQQGMWACARAIVRTEGLLALYKGLTPALAGIAPYAAINFATYDGLKAWAYGAGPQSAAGNLGLGAAAGTLASTVCYPLDTIRRRMQMRGRTYAGQADAFRTIWRTEGMSGFYQGWLANTLKVAPQSSIRFVAYEALKGFLAVKRARTDT